MRTKLNDKSIEQLGHCRATIFRLSEDLGRQKRNKLRLLQGKFEPTRQKGYMLSKTNFRLLPFSHVRDLHTYTFKNHILDDHFSRHK